MRRTYREKIYRCGDHLEVQVFPVFKRGNTSRRGRSKPTSEMQARLNQKNAERALTRILNANFTEDDISVTLTFSDEYLPDTYEEAERLFKNFIRRLGYLRKKRGLPEMRYVKIPGPGRFHFHVPMSGGISDKELQRLWPYGYANAIHFVFDENGLEGHARYIAKQFEDSGNMDIFSMFDIDEETGEVNEKSELGIRNSKLKRAKGQRRYSCSKNIVRPEAEEKDGRISAARVEELATVDSSSRAAFEKMYPGYVFSSCRPYYNEENGGYYLEIKMYKSDAAFLKSRKHFKKYRN
jgi:hypothetical protein